MRILGVLLGFFLTTQAQEPVNYPGEEGPLYIADIRLTSDNNERAELVFKIHLDKGFYAYENKLTLKIKKPSGVLFDGLVATPLIEFPDSVSKKTKKGLHGDGEIKTLLVIPKGIDPKASIEGELEYYACTVKYCLTPRVVPFSIPLDRKGFVATIKSVNKTNTTEKWNADYIEKALDQNIWYALFVIFCVGLLTSLTPCIYPLIPITLAVIGSRSEGITKFKAFRLSLTYVLGMAATYSILGVIAAQTGSLFGSALSHPAVLLFVGLVFIILAFGMFGFYEVAAPAWLQTKLLRDNDKPSGSLSIFITGMVSGIVASPCVGPVLVGVLAYIAQTQNPYLGFILLFTFSMGIGVLLLAIGTFSSLVNKLPKSGGWMNLIKNFFGCVMLVMALYYLMLSYNQFNFNTDSTEVSVSKKSHLPWIKYSEDEVKKATEAGKPIIIDFYADWCAACVELEEKTFVDAAVRAKSKEFILLKVDATKVFDGLEALQEKYKVYGLPTIVFIDESGKMRKDLSLTGFEKSAPFLDRMFKAKPSQNPKTP